MSSHRSLPTKYTVVTSDDFGKFEDRVNELLEEGWQLQGGVSTSILSAGDRLHIQFSQALILTATGPAAQMALEEALPLPADSDAFSAGL